jgi:hypothetical protein
MPVLADTAASAWKYLAEGNKHILFTYVGSKPQLADRVLYLLKTNAEAAADDAEESGAMHREQAFTKDIFQKYLGEEYVHVGKVVSVPSDLLWALHESSSQGGIRPLVRASTSRINTGAGSAMLLRNCHVFAAGSLTPAGSPFTVELKPKQGVLPTSQLLRDCCLQKRHHSAFKLKQRVKRKKWRDTQKEHSNAHEYELSGYEPLELFSCNKEQMKNALDALVRNPQNNFRLCIDGKPVFDAEESDGRPKRNGGHMVQLEEALEEALLPLFGINQQQQGSGGVEAAEFATQMKETEMKQCKALKAVLYRILAQEPLLRRLKSLQQLDVLDADGAALVHARALILCGGDEQQLNRLVGESERAPLPLPLASGAAGEAAMVLAMPPAPPVQSNASSDGGRETLTAQTMQTSSSYEQQREECVRWTEQLAIEECVQLLHHWLVALAATDCSLMITMQPVQTDGGGEGANVGAAGQDTANVGAAGQDTPQSTSTPGRVTYQLKNGAAVQLAYRMEVVDTGPKPLSKLHRHCKQDQEMCEYFEEEGAVERLDRQQQGCIFIRGWVFGMAQEELDRCYVQLTDELRRNKQQVLCWDGDINKCDSYASLIARLMEDAEFAHVRFVAFKHEDKLHALRKGYEEDDYGVLAKGFDVDPTGLTMFKSTSGRSTELGLFAASAKAEDEGNATILQWAAPVSTTSGKCYHPTGFMTAVGLPLAKKDFLGLSAEGLRFAKATMGVTLTTVMTFGEGYITRENLAQVEHFDQRDDYPRCVVYRAQTSRKGTSGATEYAPLTCTPKTDR